MIFNREHKSLIPFVMAGFPSLSESEKLASALIDEGCLIVEIGVPFSDPLADGPAIQRASECALRNGTTLLHVLKLIGRLKVKHPKASFVLFTYLNPLLRSGLANSIRAAADSGVDGTLTVDLPLEEARRYIELHENNRLKTVFLISPTTSSERALAIANTATGFIYCLSRSAVTGERANLSPDLILRLEDRLKQLQTTTEIPLAVGFGFSTPSQTARITRFADAVVIGSRFVNIIEQSSGFAEAEVIARELVRSCLGAMNPLPERESAHE